MNARSALRPRSVTGLGLAALLSLHAACGDDGTTFVDEDPPTGGGEGGFDPGPSPNGTASGAYGYGANGPTTTTSGEASSASSGSGTGGEEPPECADELKRCAHVFTYENADASSVEVPLNEVGAYSGADVLLTATAANGIVAADDSEAWSGVTDYVVPS